MGGGLMQLVAYGAQDVYLTGNPQITFFKVVYRRHTNFSVETIEQAVDSAKPSGRYTVTVHRNGDLATNCAFRVKVPAVLAGDLTGVSEIAWVRRLGHALIKQVEIEIGGSKIDRHVGTWLDIWYELTHTQSQERGYNALIGDVPEMTQLRAVDSSSTTNEVLPEYTLYIPFQFWFCRNYGLALPLIALQYHEVRFHIELEAITKLLVWSGTSAPALNNFSFRSAGVMVDYVYLDAEERRRFAQVGHEYLIEQVQFTGGESLFGASTKGSSLNNKFKLNFNHPCKEVVWALKAGAFSGEGVSNSFTGSNTFLAYSHTDAGWDAAVNAAAKGLVESSVVANTGAVPDDHAGVTTAAESSPETVGKLSVTLVATGTYVDNLVVVRTAKLLGDSSVDLLSNVTSADVTVHYDVTSAKVTKVECTAVVHTLTLRDLSIPLTAWTVDNRSTNGVNNKTFHVIQHSNYGLRLDGAGNPTQKANLELNGHARFNEQEGSYFNYWQTRAHTRTPADGVNVYCFGLHPENHQPSGTANLSRIDTTLLVITFSDPLRPKSSGVPSLDWTTDSVLFIFALSYNILRVMSGMAGIAYSN
jgi:hypothetical protein